MNKVWNILKSVGAAVITTVAPVGGSLIVSAINELLPSDKQLPENATGAQASSAIASLPPEQQAMIMSKEFDVQIETIRETGSALREMLSSDRGNPHSTRPMIAWWSFVVVAISALAVIAVWGFAVISGKQEMVKAVMNGWPFITAILAPLVALLYAYFGILKTEQKNRLDAVNGNEQPTGLSGFINTLIKR